MAREKVVAEERLQQQLDHLRESLVNDHLAAVAGLNNEIHSLNNEINEAQVCPY